MTLVMDAIEDDFFSLRGRRVGLSTLWDRERFDGKTRLALRDALIKADPFPHLVIDGLFSADLLELIVDEFDQMTPAYWRHSKCPDESTRRARFDASLPPAADLYFNKIYSKEFVAFLCEILGVETLIPDPELIGGGLHESRAGDWFNIHVDFVRHGKTRLKNEMVMITYLNKDWREEYGGALELWDSKTRTCAKTVVPVFGRTIIMKHTETSLHGHTKPICAPDDRPRRSIAAYYYGSRQKVEATQRDRLASKFLQPRMTPVAKAKMVARLISPPILIEGVKLARAKLHLKTDWQSSSIKLRPR